MSEPDYDFLNEEAPDDVVPEVTHEVVPEPDPPAAATVETPEPPAPVVPTTPEPHEERVPLAALKEERRKRQEYEAKLRQYEQQQQAQPPNFYDAPQQYLEQQISQRAFAMSEAMAREMYPDYDEVVEEFVEYAQDKPYLAAELNTSAHPAAFAYKQGKALRERKQLEDLPAYKAKLEAEIRSKLEAEYQAKEQARTQAAAAIPPDIAAARSSRDEDVQPDDSLESILKSKR